MSKAFPHLLSPLQVGAKTLRNRVLITGHVPRLADNNLVGERYVAYHRARARGGAGLQITGAQGVHPSGVLGTAYSLANLDDRVIPGYRLLAEGVHAEGGTILAQLAHGAGTLNVSDVGRPLLSPSAVQSELARETPRAMSKRDIAEMIGCFERAAGRVKAGGLDGVELLAAFGFLLGAFLSPLTNKRLDRYGGSEANRARFVLEVAEAVRGALGPDLILGLRIPGDELTEGGLSNTDLVSLSRRLTADGRINYLNVIAGTNYKRLGRMVHWGPTPTPHGLFVPLAAAIKRQVKVPVFVTGRVTDPALAEKFLAEGAADMIGMTRAHIADPEIVRKIERGDAEAIRPCVGANVCISLTGGALRCFHNPEVGRETEWPALAPASKPLQVAVIGGGPAGLEAARAAAARGHRVTLYEASNRLGGRLALWAEAPLTRELGKAVQWRIEQLKRLQVRVELGRRLKPEDLAALGADAILLATGSAPLSARKFDGVATATPEEVLRHSPQVEGRVVVWDHGGGREALAAAEALVSAGRAVTLVTNEFAVGEGVDPVVRTVIHQHLLKGGAIFRVGEDLLRSEPGAVVLRNLYSGQETRIDNVSLLVHWQGRVAEDALLGAARKAAPVAKLIGDALSPRGVTLAVAEGQRAARDL